MLIYEASVSGVLRIILWFIAISIIIRIIARLAFPIVVRKANQAMRERANQANGFRDTGRKEGEVIVENKQPPVANHADGEYVDYIEIKE